MLENSFIQQYLFAGTLQQRAKKIGNKVILSMPTTEE